MSFENADQSWYPRVLRTLARDYPEISDKVWTTAITENAVEKEHARHAPAPAPAPRPWYPCDDCTTPITCEEERDLDRCP